MYVLNVPIEPIKERYSEQWDAWFTNEFTVEDVPHETIYGERVNDSIVTGSFLDVCDTNVYKMTQGARVLKAIKNYQNNSRPLIVFFHDLWNPILFNIAYMRDGLQKRNIKVVGCLHAGSYDPQDFLFQRGMTKWAEQAENSMFGAIADRIYVATQYHKELLARTRIVDRDKIVITGFPMYPEWFAIREPFPQREDMIVFPHRLDPEKQPEMFDVMKLDPALAFHWHFVRTKDVCLSKSDYYKTLYRARYAVSFALQETWGIAMQEAAMCGAIPLVPRRLSYPELYLNKFIYEDYADMVDKIVRGPIPPAFLEVQQDLITDRGKKAIPNMIMDMRACYGHI